MNLVLPESRFRGCGRITLRQPVEDADGNPRPSLTSKHWTLVTEQDLDLPTWVGLGDRPRQGYYWASLDEEGRVLRLVPADNVAGFVAEALEVNES